MVVRMRERPGGDRITVTMGDMSQVSTARTYRPAARTYLGQPLADASQAAKRLAGFAHGLSIEASSKTRQRSLT